MCFNLENKVYFVGLIRLKFFLLRFLVREIDNKTIMDNIDKAILMQLQKDSKLNTKEIALKIGLSVTPTYERIKKLEKQQIITSYVAKLNRKKIGKHVVAFCQVTLLKHEKSIIENFKSKVISYPEVMEVNHISGNFDFLLKVVVVDIDQFHHFINEQLAIIEGISTINSSFVMRCLKDETSYVL